MILHVIESVFKDLLFGVKKYTTKIHFIKQQLVGKNHSEANNEFHSYETQGQLIITLF